MRYLILFSFFSSAIAMAEPVVIINTVNAREDLTLNQISDIFLKKQATFTGGLEAIPIDLKEGEPTREKFYEIASQKNASQLKAYWAKSIFTGKKLPPKEFSSSEEVKKFVAAHPGAIAYIDKKEADATVKIVTSVK